MNENIVNSLKQYINDINPQYAILLSGAWGCGKTHFVEKWIDQYKTSNISKSKKQESEINLRPVKVSLFGLRTNKELYI